MDALCTRDAVAGMILAGKHLLLAGDETLLAGLPTGQWIGGTIPYFMTKEGGLKSQDRIFVTELPTESDVTIHTYDTATLPGLAADHPGNGFTVLLIPAFSRIHEEFARNTAYYEGIFDRPLLGWVSGVAVDDIGHVQPKIFDGRTASSSTENAIAMHVGLPESDHASVDIINLFVPGDGPAIRFPKTGLSADDVLIDGAPASLASFLTENRIDTQLPLIADFNGAMVNVSIQKVDTESNAVSFYAPVFPDITYRIAAPVTDYVSGFSAVLPSDGKQLRLSYNCILNYMYAGLEGRSTAPLLGPMTFGEIAYMLLNQTAVYLTITRSP